MSITRFSIPVRARLIRHADGEFVLYADHLTQVEHLKWRIEQLEKSLNEAQDLNRKNDRKNKS